MTYVFGQYEKQLSAVQFEKPFLIQSSEKFIAAKTQDEEGIGVQIESKGFCPFFCTPHSGSSYTVLDAMFTSDLGLQ